LISWLDGYVALSCVDPARIQRLIKSETKSGAEGRSSRRAGRKASAEENAAAAAAREISRVWNDITPDVIAISTLPAASEEISSTSKRLGTIKRIFTVLAVVIVGFYLVLANLNVLQAANLAVRIGLIFGVVVAYYIVLYAYLRTNRKLGELIERYYQSHAGEVSVQRKRIKDATQRLIDVLASQIRAREQGDGASGPEKYEMSLLNRDYTNINVLRVDEKGSKKSAMKRYIVAIKGKKVSQ